MYQLVRPAGSKGGRMTTTRSETEWEAFERLLIKSRENLNRVQESMNAMTGRLVSVNESLSEMRSLIEIIRQEEASESPEAEERYVPEGVEESLESPAKEEDRGGDCEGLLLAMRRIEILAVDDMDPVVQHLASMDLASSREEEELLLTKTGDANFRWEKRQSEEERMGEAQIQERTKDLPPLHLGREEEIFGPVNTSTQAQQAKRQTLVITRGNGRIGGSLVNSRGHGRIIHQPPLTRVEPHFVSENQLAISSSASDVRLWDATSISGVPKHSFEGIKAADSVIQLDMMLKENGLEKWLQPCRLVLHYIAGRRIGGSLVNSRGHGRIIHQPPLTRVEPHFVSENQLAISSSASDVRLWDATSISGVPKHSFEGIKAARFSNSGSVFAALRSDPSHREILYDVHTCQLDMMLKENGLEKWLQPCRLVLHYIAGNPERAGLLFSFVFSMETTRVAIFRPNTINLVNATHQPFEFGIAVLLLPPVIWSLKYEKLSMTSKPRKYGVVAWLFWYSGGGSEDRTQNHAIIGKMERIVLVVCMFLFTGSVLALGGIIPAQPLDDISYKGSCVIMLEQVANATNEVAGDGTTCVIVLTQAIIAKGHKSVAAGMTAMDLSRGVPMAVDAVVTNLKSRTSMISTSEEITQVGTVSDNGEREIGELIAKAMEKVGKVGVITIQDGKTWFNELEVGEGLKLDSEPNLQNLVGTVDNLENLEFDELDCLGEIDQYHDEAVFVSETGHGESGEISQPQGNYYDKVGMDPVTSFLFLNNLENGRVNYQWTDKQRCAPFTATEANQMLTTELQLYLEEVNLDMLGSCKKVSSKDDTVILNRAGEKKDVEERSEQSRAAIKLSTSADDKEKTSEAQFPYFNLGDKVASKSGVLLWTKILITKINGLGPTLPGLF
ncbi:heat shock protein 60 [Dorcoceras hygrometricum]|uniref:Heat shock protein 60 n=1 Tax=Dorcoceras hygrometricum TaxID=472368 RepID=A0A2Z7C663_9LAMI|nr:heat shock protein 60 [Dorcoceras hygrometricum]